MRKKILFGTRNQTKRQRFQELLDPLGLDILSLHDFGISTEVKESGKTPKENAVKKAATYFALTNTNIPTFAVDYGLYIDKFPKEKQPGLFVRRIYGQDHEVTDEEMLNYYKEELEKVGGESEGSWVSAIALVTSDGRVFVQNFTHRTKFTAIVSSTRRPGEPLSSLQIDPVLLKYHSEMTPEERAQSQSFLEKEYFEFMKSHIQEL
jgi:inosine/xanthosine triphosphate pyrophosphatase family protein